MLGVHTTRPRTFTSDDVHFVQAVASLLAEAIQRLQAERALAAERTLLRTLVDNLPDAVYVKDTAGRKTLANPADVHNMGATSEAYVFGKSDFDFFPSELAAAFTADDQRVIRTGQPILNREEQITRPDGRSRVVRGPPVAPSLLATLSFERMLVLPIRADPLEGVILVLDQEEPATEDLAFGAMVSAQISVGLQRWHAQMTHRATAANAERVRLSRDLHDGVLQFLAGAAIQLEGLLRAGNLPVAPAGPATGPDRGTARIAHLHHRHAPGPIQRAGQADRPSRGVGRAGGPPFTLLEHLRPG